jgi:chemotaxis protein MotB
MWLLGSTTEGDKKGIADYFASPLKLALMSSGSGARDAAHVIKGGGQDLTRATGQVKRGDVEAQRDTVNLHKLKAEQARAQAELAFNAWRSVLVRAVAEVDSSIAGAVLAAESRDRFGRALLSAADTERLGRMQYAQGTITLDHLLDLQDELYSFQDAEAQARGLAAQSAVALYRALGGGWQDVAPARMASRASREGAAEGGSCRSHAAIASRVRGSDP